MSFPIKTNQIYTTIDWDRFEEKYEVFRIRTSEKYIKSGARILDAPSLNQSIMSVHFEQGNSLLLLVDKNKFTVTSIKECLSAIDSVETLAIERTDPQQLGRYMVIQLLLNSMGNFDLSFLRFNNLTGHLYCFNPSWLKHGRKTEADVIWQVPCLEVQVTKEGLLKFPVRTFTSTKLKNQMVFDKRKFSDYPQYVLTAKNTLRRRLESDNAPAFILRQIDGQKTSIPFMGIKDTRAFEASKMGMLRFVVSMFNKQFDGIASIKWTEVSNYDAVEYTRQCAKEDHAHIGSALANNPIKIVDTIHDEYSIMFCEEIAEILLRKYNLKASIGKRISKGSLNIRIIHNADYYDGMDDPHKQFVDTSVQHITLEDFRHCAEFGIDTVIHELLIKQDLLDSKIRLFDWSRTGFTDSVSFGIPASLNGTEKYIFMKIQPDGSFQIAEEEFDLFHIQQYQDCINIFENAKASGEHVLGLIRSSKGMINSIKDTSWITIPEIEKIYAELIAGNNKLRGRIAREELLSASLDIKAFSDGDAAYYFVGIIGEGMRPVINWAANIRKIEPYQNAPLIYNELLPTMCTAFVRNGQLTAMPFPFKYLREHARSKGYTL